MRYYIDCEFDGHGGPLLSIALVREDGRSIHIGVLMEARDPWVVENVVPIMGRHGATFADSPVDIGRFCSALTTSPLGGWASAEYPLMTFEVHNVDCYPTTLEGAVQHNAWWDAMALRQKLTTDPA